MRKCALVLVAAGGLGCGGEPGRDDGHDVIKLRMQTNEADTFDGTASMVASLEYDNCLLDFYAGGGADLTADGVEGAPVFDDWSTRLCDYDGLEAAASCEVLAIDQDLDNVFLRVEYGVDDLVQNEQLAFGPIPSMSLTDCTPTMAMTAAHQVTGFDGNGEILWITQSWEPDRAASGGGQAIAITAAPED